MDATKQRWINELAKYDFSPEYQKGKNNTVADALSRIKEERLSKEEADKFLEFVPMIPGDEAVVKIFKEDGCDWKLESPAPYTVSSAAMKAVFDNLTLGAGRRAELEYNIGSPIHDEVDSIKVSVKSARLNSQVHVTNWAEAQQEDPEIKAAMDWCWFNRKKSKPLAQQLLKFKSCLSPNKNTPTGKSLLKNADQLTLCGGLLYHRYTPKYQVDNVKCFIVLRSHRRTAINGCHHDMGHQGKKRMESLVSDQFWWLGVYEDVDRAVKNCRRCQPYGGREEKAPMVPMMVTAPLQLVHLDFTLFKTTTNLNESPKVENILVIVDHFTRYTRAYVSKDQKASTAAKILYKGFISIFRAPKRILTDQGKAFTSKVVEQLCPQFGISQSTTTAYHPQGNGQVE